MISSSIEAPPNRPTSERQCSKGGPCVAILKDNTWVCKKCGTAMGPGVAKSAHSMTSRTVDVVLRLELTADDVHQLLATYIAPGEIFRDRSELDMHLTQAIVLAIRERKTDTARWREARLVIEELMPELARHLS